MPCSHPKLIYLAQRNPAFDHDAFIQRWRQHARLGMSLKRWRNVRRYVHCDPLPSQPSGFAIEPCDGVAMVWYRSEEMRTSHAGDSAEREIMRRDEGETFAAPVRAFSALIDETVHLPRAYTSEQTRLLLFVRSAQGGADWLRDHAREMLHVLSNVGRACGYTLNAVRTDKAAQGFGLTCVCVDEVTIPHAELQSVIAVLAASALPSRTEDNIQVTAIATSTVVHWDMPEPIEPGSRD